MAIDSSLPQRKFPRLKGYDYSQVGTYFVTICVRERQPVFGEVIGDIVSLSREGLIAKEVWSSLMRRFPGVALQRRAKRLNHLALPFVGEKIATMLEPSLRILSGDGK